MKALVGAFNQEKGLLRDCTTGCGTDGALHSTIRDTISRHIIPLADQSRPLQSPPDMFRDEQSLRYPANRWNAGIMDYVFVIFALAYYEDGGEYCIRIIPK